MQILELDGYVNMSCFDSDQMQTTYALYIYDLLIYLLTYLLLHLNRQVWCLIHDRHLLLLSPKADTLRRKPCSLTTAVNKRLSVKL